MEKTLFKYILKNSKKEQLFIVLLSSLSLPFYYLSLEMPKQIINKAIGAPAQMFPQSVDLFGYEIMRLGQVPLLLLFCLVFLSAVLVTGGLKYQLNVYKGLLGERLLRALRRELCGRILRFPLAHFRKISPGELNAMITAEVEPLAGFIGDAFALPLLQGGLLLTAMLFIFVQDPILGIAAVALFPVQAYVIPKLRREVLELSRRRVQEVRRFSTRIGDAVTMKKEVRSNAAGAYELAMLDRYLERLLDIRYRLFRRKFFVKFLNNFLFQLTPFLFLLIGGYMVIKRDLTLGALVAVLAAYKDLPPPAKELLDYYQEKQDAHIKYEQVVAQFAPLGMYPPEFLTETEVSSEPLSGDLIVHDVSVIEEGVNVIDKASFTVALDQHLAIVDAAGHAGEALTQLLVRLIEPSQGTISIGGRKLEDLSHAWIGRKFAYVDADPGFLSGTVAENLFYGFAIAMRENRRAEAMRVLNAVGLTGDMYHLGLSAVITPERHPVFTQRLIEARRAVRAQLVDAATGALFEPFDRRRYCAHASIAENLLFGEPVSEAFAVSRLTEDRYVMSVIKRAGLLPDLIKIGCAAATAVLEAYGADIDVPEDYEGRVLAHADELALLRALPERVAAAGVKRLSKSERQLLLSMALKVVASRHSFCFIDEKLRSRIVHARKRFIRHLPTRLREHIAFFDPDAYNPALTIQDNLLFGRLAEERPNAVRRIGPVLDAVVNQLNLREQISEAGLEYHVGVNGARLKPSQRQQLAVARGLLKRPDVFVACRATNALDASTEQDIIKNVRQELNGRCIVWVFDHLALAQNFDRVLALSNGRVIKQFASSDLDKQVVDAAESASSERASGLGGIEQ